MEEEEEDRKKEEKQLFYGLVSKKGAFPPHFTTLGGGAKADRDVHTLVLKPQAKQGKGRKGPCSASMPSRREANPKWANPGMGLQRPGGLVTSLELPPWPHLNPQGVLALQMWLAISFVS